MGRTLSHQVGQKIDRVVADPLDFPLFSLIVAGFQDVLLPPFQAGCRAEHAAHQMESAVCVPEGMDRVVFSDGKAVAGDEHRPRGPDGYAAASVFHRAGSDG
ncbi:hypothetical protein SDC9_194224 [bioreactor metagenome]|uniref:Uncharacterized protein n=1 Tax=bioreactor metagenome TaxID=1076179 RepID=A0A645IGZ8_9ZZZZ